MSSYVYFLSFLMAPSWPILRFATIVLDVFVTFLFLATNTTIYWHLGLIPFSFILFHTGYWQAQQK